MPTLQQFIEHFCKENYNDPNCIITEEARIIYQWFLDNKNIS